MFKPRRILTTIAAVAAIVVAGAIPSQASTNYQSGRCWPSGATSSASLFASSWWYDAPLYGKTYHVGMTGATISGVKYSPSKIYIPNYGYASNTSDFTVGFGTHANGYVVGTWHRSNVNSILSDVTCRIYL